MKITTEWLQEHRACADQIELFGQTFPGGADITAECLIQACEAGLDISSLRECGVDLTGITQLPEGLQVGGSLDLRATGITQLPEGLTVPHGITMPDGDYAHSVDRARRLLGGDQP